MRSEPTRRPSRQRRSTLDAAAARSPDLVIGAFVPERPNQLWLADVAYGSTSPGGLDVAFVLNVYSRAIVGRQMADHPRVAIVLGALEMAIWGRRAVSTEGLVPSPTRMMRGTVRRVDLTTNVRSARPRY